MKKLLILVPAFMVLNVFPQELITVSPAIGPVLDKQEQGFYKILPNVDGFLEASFYLNADSSVTAVIKYEENGTVKDSLYPFKNPLTIHDYLVQQLVSYLKMNNIPQYNIYLNNGEEFNAYLYSIDTAAVTFFDRKENRFRSFLNNEITELGKTMKNSASFFHYAGGCLFGGVLGAVIGNSVGERDPDAFLIDERKLESTCIGGVIGGLAGILIGGLTGSQGTETVTYQPRENGFYYLHEDAVLK